MVELRSCTRGSLGQRSEKNSSLKEWLGTGIVCLGRWCLNHPWKCFKKAWTWLSVPGFR